MSIPLTIDWLTLAWLKTRLHLWWRVGRASPRQLALLLVLGLFSGCVPVTRFEETQSAAQVEMEGRRRSEYQVAQLQKELAELRQRMQQQSQTLDEQGQALSQAQLDSSTVGKQREDAEGMVEQLRGELARVGGHLQTFHDGQQKLEAALATEAARGCLETPRCRWPNPSRLANTRSTPSRARSCCAPRATRSWPKTAQ